MITLKLDAELEKNKKTAYELHKKTGLHQSVISKLKRNEAKMIALDVLDKICDALCCEPSDLIDYQPNNPKEEKPAGTPETLKKPVAARTISKSAEGMLSTVEAAARLNVSRKSVNDYILKGKLKATKGKGNHNLVSEADLQEFINNR
jgi:putative transcriptional regulator